MLRRTMYELVTSNENQIRWRREGVRSGACTYHEKKWVEKGPKNDLPPTF
jgi:hypothetical protein